MKRTRPLLKAISMAVVLLVPAAVLATQTCRTLDLPQSAPLDRYIVNSGGTVTDATTGLIWKRCSEGQSGADCENGRAATYSWREAVALAAVTDFNRSKSWRLPTVSELATLLEYQCTMPAINLTAFPATPATNYWTATPYAGYVNGAWNINFNDGVHDNSSKNYRLYVRLVRGAVTGGELK
jgi:hypothetical protein